MDHPPGDKSPYFAISIALAALLPAILWARRNAKESLKVQDTETASTANKAAAGAASGDKQAVALHLSNAITTIDVQPVRRESEPGTAVSPSAAVAIEEEQQEVTEIPPLHFRSASVASVDAAMLDEGNVHVSEVTTPAHSSEQGIEMQPSPVAAAVQTPVVIHMPVVTPEQ